LTPVHNDNAESLAGIVGRLLQQARADRSGAAADAALRVPDARRLGLRMAALYRKWQRTGGPDLRRLTEALLAHIGLPAASPLAETCRAAAAAVSEWQGSAYHSARHHAEVATNAMVLATISGRQGSPLPARDLGLLLAAALAHDLNYEPTQDRRVRFAAEARSAKALDAIAARCGLGKADRRAVRLLILATEPDSRPDLAALIADAGAARLPPLLAPLAKDARLPPLAALLSDADLLSSAGLTRSWAAVQGRRLAHENQMPVGRAEWRRFFRDIVGPGFLSAGGHHFAGNLAWIRSSWPAEPG
jgi:hypothetical protein